MNNPFYSETLMKYMGGLKFHLMTLSYTPNYQDEEIEVGPSGTIQNKDV
jgi:hypothetical protein